MHVIVMAIKNRDQVLELPTGTCGYLAVIFHNQQWAILAVQSFFFSSRRRHTSSLRDWSSDVCSSDLTQARRPRAASSDLSARRAAGDQANDGCAEQEAERGGGRGRGRTEGKPRHETPFPALGPFSHRHLQGGGEGGIDRLRRIPETEEPLVPDLASNVSEIPVAEYGAFVSHPPPPVVGQEARHGVTENGGAAAREPTGEAPDRRDRMSVNARPPPGRRRLCLRGEPHRGKPHGHPLRLRRPFSISIPAPI